MEKNIFEGAKFGDKFVTRDGRIGLFLSHNIEDNNTIKYPVHIILKHNYEQTVYTTNGIPYIKNVMGWQDKEKVIEDLSIVSRYQKPITSKEIDEDKLDELAIEYVENTIWDSTTSKDEYEAYKAGYRKAKEE